MIFTHPRHCPATQPGRRPHAGTWNPKVIIQWTHLKRTYREGGGCEHGDSEHLGELGQAGHGAGLQGPGHQAPWNNKVSISPFGKCICMLLVRDVFCVC